jgi:hypothetical protein
MKSYKQFANNLISEDKDGYPVDSMTMKELEIIINSANSMIEMLENGGTIQRWQISAVAVASKKLASIHASMSADYENDDSEQMEFDVYDESEDY